MGYRMPGDPDHPDHVDVQYAQPLVVAVHGDVPHGADPGVVHHDVQPAEPLDHGVDGGFDLDVVGDVDLDAHDAVREPLRFQIEGGDPGSPAAEQIRRGQTYSRRTAGDDRDHPCEVTHEFSPVHSMVKSARWGCRPWALFRPA